MSCCPGLRIPSVNIPFCCYLTTQGESTGTLPFRDWIADSNKMRQPLSQTLPAILPVSLQPDDTRTVTLHTPDGYAIACPLTLLPDVMRVLARC
ncbi:hypothetical protein [Photorhabdus akhurstii]|uniref:hypothetical protein n=1 Tax=Photorhabdus akhurstii TaxID=171438 RepID=UPI00370425B5